VIFIVKFGVLVSSIRYKIFSDGRAIKISMNAGRMVQIVSISCPSAINLLKFFISSSEVSTYKVRIVMAVIMIMAWSWKKRICSIDKEVVS